MGVGGVGAKRAGRSVLGAVVLAVVSACEPREVDISVQLVTQGCVAGSALEGATHLRVRVTGDGLESPLDVIGSASNPTRELRIPEVPPGTGRSVEVRAYSGEPSAGGRVVAMGRSMPFDIPSRPLDRKDSLEVVVFLRKVGVFTPPSSIIATSTCSKMLVPRAGHTATLLKDGRVLIAGGFGLHDTERHSLSEAELYNPATGAFEELPKIGLTIGSKFSALGRAFHTATLLPTGQVLIWGGEEYTAGNDNGEPALPRSSVLVFDPDLKSYAAIPPGNLPGLSRTRHAAAIDKNGKVVIVGGQTRSEGATTLVEAVEWFDPSTTLGKLVPGVSLPRVEHSLAPVQGGELIALAGGSDGLALPEQVELFAFDGTTFQKRAADPLRKLQRGRRAAGAVPFHGGTDLLLLGGFTDLQQPVPEASSELVVARESVSVSAGPAIFKRGNLCSALLQDGRVLAVGGRTRDTPFSNPRSDGSVEVIVPLGDGTNSTLGREALKTPRYWHSCTTLLDGTVLVLGGIREYTGSPLETIQDALIYTPEPLD